MLGAKAENQLRLAKTELNGRIALLEKMLIVKERGREALQDSEKRYRRLFESAKDCSFSIMLAPDKQVNPT